VSVPHLSSPRIVLLDEILAWWRELLRTASTRSSQNPPCETVWKIGKAPSSSRSPEWGKGVEEPYFAVLCHQTYTIENPFGYFPNSFSTHSGE